MSGPTGRAIGWALVFLAALGTTLSPILGDDEPAPQRWTVTVSETAGIRRGGYPVSAVIELKEPVKDVKHFRLLHEGKAVPAQFGAHGITDTGIRAVSVDFQTTLAPLKKREYIVEHGPAVKPGPQPTGGLKVETKDDGIHVIHSPSFQFVVPYDLHRLLQSVPMGKGDYLRPNSPGLLVRDKDGKIHRAGPREAGEKTHVDIDKRGPLTAVLRSEVTEPLAGEKPVRSVVEMEFPHSRSWVRVTWTVEDKASQVAALGAELNLNVQGEPTLVDIGAGSLVYAQLRKGQAAALRSRSRIAIQPELQYDIGNWQVLLGQAGTLVPHVESLNKITMPPAEGWVHVMDRQRCTAAALAGVADHKQDQQSELVIGADGKLELWRQFSPPPSRLLPGTKSITFWLHFVSMPVHVGAATSPQSMMNPPQIEVLPR